MFVEPVDLIVVTAALLLRRPVKISSSNAPFTTRDVLPLHLSCWHVFFFLHPEDNSLITCKKHFVSIRNNFVLVVMYRFGYRGSTGRSEMPTPLSEVPALLIFFFCPDPNTPTYVANRAACCVHLINICTFVTHVTGVCWTIRWKCCFIASTLMSSFCSYWTWIWCWFTHVPVNWTNRLLDTKYGSRNEIVLFFLTYRKM